LSLLGSRVVSIIHHHHRLAPFFSFPLPAFSFQHRFQPSAPPVPMQVHRPAYLPTSPIPPPPPFSLLPSLLQVSRNSTSLSQLTASALDALLISSAAAPTPSSFLDNHDVLSKDHQDFNNQTPSSSSSSCSSSSSIGDYMECGWWLAHRQTDALGDKSWAGNPLSLRGVSHIYS
jgi:hypothetical protein